MNLYFSQPLEQRHISQVYATEKTFDNSLQQAATNKITILKPTKLKVNTHVSVPVVDKTPEKSTIPSIYTNNSSTVSNTSNSSTSSGSSFSISGILSTAESDFSKYFDYILIGGIALFVFFMFSGSSNNSQTKYVDVKIPE